MRVLLLTLCYLPDSAPNAPVMTALAEGLAKLGHELIVVTAFPHYGQSQPYSGYAGWRFQHECHDGIRIVRTPLYVGGESSRFGKMLSWFSFNLVGTWAAVRLGPADVIIAPSPPPTLGLSEALLSKLWRVPYIYNVQDIYPDVVIEQGFLNNPCLTTLLRKVENLVYNHAAAVTVLSEYHRANLLTKSVSAHKAVVIPNFVDTDRMRPLPRHNSWSSEQGLNDSFVVTYAGNIGASQGLEILLEAAMLLRKRDDIIFLVIGRGTSKVALETQARSSKLTNVHFFPFQPWERVPEVYASADLHLVLMRKGITSSVPSKIYTIMAAGRPLLTAAEANSEAASLVRRAHAGVVVAPEDSKALAEAILTLAGDAETRRRMAESGRAHVVEHYSKQAIAQQYDALIRQLVAQHKTRGRNVWYNR